MKSSNQVGKGGTIENYAGGSLVQEASQRVEISLSLSVLGLSKLERQLS